MINAVYCECGCGGLQMAIEQVFYLIERSARYEVRAGEEEAAGNVGAALQYRELAKKANVEAHEVEVCGEWRQLVWLEEGGRWEG